MPATLPTQPGISRWSYSRVSLRPDRMALVLLVCGEALIDLVGQPDGGYLARPGGGPANTAVTLGRLGVPVALAARLSTDPVRRADPRPPRRSRRRPRLRPRTVEEPTTLAVATLDDCRPGPVRLLLAGHGRLAVDGRRAAEPIPQRPGRGPRLARGRAAARRRRGRRPGPALRRPLVLDPNVRPDAARRPGRTTGDGSTRSWRRRPWSRSATRTWRGRIPGEDPVEVARDWAGR